MKKALLVVVVLILLLMGGAGLWIWRALSGPGDAALLVPSETVMLASLPDMARSAMRWPQTSLSQIGIEPEMKAFLEKPLNYLSKSGGGDEAAQILLRLKPRRIFMAVTGLTTADANMLLGFQFLGSNGDHDAAVARLRDELLHGQPKQELKKESYQGDEITSVAYRKGMLYSAHRGNWGFLSNNLATIQDALDRVAARAKTSSLAENSKYKETASQLLAQPDFFFFLQPQPIVDALLHVGKLMNAQAIPAQVEAIKKIEGAGFSLKLDGADMHDRTFVLYQNPPDNGTLSHSAIKATSTQTTAYFDFMTKLDELAKLQATPAFAALALYYPTVFSSPLFQLVPQAFGPEAAISLFWPAGSMKPEALVALQVKDSAKAAEALQALLAQLPETTVSANDGQTYYNFPSLNSPFLTPTLTLTKGFLLVGLDTNDVVRAVKAERKDETLDKSPAFAPALPSYHSANQAFGYIDSRQVFERVYTPLRQVMSFGAGFIPGASDMIDSSKLPQTETIAKHLQPILYSQSRVSNGYLMESSGPITLNQAFLLGIAGTGAFEAAGSR